jgi:hypothetical protein
MTQQQHHRDGIAQPGALTYAASSAPSRIVASPEPPPGSAPNRSRRMPLIRAAAWRMVALIRRLGTSAASCARHL